MSFFIRCLLSCALFLPVIALAQGDAEAFFEKYVRLGQSFDLSVASLYHDEAEIIGYRVYPFGHERVMTLKGAQWKGMIHKVMPAAKLRNDRSSYSNVTVSVVDDGYKIKADRYSMAKCYTDKGYYMIVKSGSDKSLLIVEEYIETRPMPYC